MKKPQINEASSLASLGDMQYICRCSGYGSILSLLNTSVQEPARYAVSLCGKCEPAYQMKSPKSLNGNNNNKNLGTATTATKSHEAHKRVDCTYRKVSRKGGGTASTLTCIRASLEGGLHGGKWVVMSKFNEKSWFSCN